MSFMAVMLSFARVYIDIFLLSDWEKTVKELCNN